jgi:hypothetical protein
VSVLLRKAELLQQQLLLRRGKLRCVCEFSLRRTVRLQYVHRYFRRAANTCYLAVVHTQCNNSKYVHTPKSKLSNKIPASICSHGPLEICRRCTSGPTSKRIIASLLEINQLERSAHIHAFTVNAFVTKVTAILCALAILAGAAPFVTLVCFVPTGVWLMLSVDCPGIPDCTSPIGDVGVCNVTATPPVCDCTNTPGYGGPGCTDPVAACTDFFKLCWPT